jgi:transcriptional regulator
MYTPEHFAVEDRRELIAFMREYPFAAIATARDGHVEATHAPLTIVERGDELVLVGHFARANPHWKALEAGAESLAIFAGPHAYISPSLYESKLSVPTWNYAVVHAYGHAVGIDAEQAVLQLVQQVDPAYRGQWDELPEQFRSKMLNGVAAFEIHVSRLEGKYKLSQNRPAGDQARVASSFAGTDLGELMKRRQR